MSDTIELPDADRPRITKSARVTKLLARSRGATLADITIATGWQPHSARAFLSGLRKKAVPLVREQRRDGSTAYRIAKAAETVAGSDAADA